MNQAIRVKMSNDHHTGAASVRKVVLEAPVEPCSRNFGSSLLTHVTAIEALGND